jgi:hypothetical protein
MTVLDGVVISQGVAFGREADPWTPWAGDPSPLSGNTPLTREINVLYADYRKRVDYLEAAKQAPKDAQAALEALHQGYLDAVHADAQAGKPSGLAEDLRAKRDAAERDHRGTAWQEAIDGASAAVDQAREAYVSFCEQNYARLILERLPEGEQVAREYAKAHDELEAKLTPIRQHWAELWEDSRKIVGSIHDFRREDLPVGNEYHKPPVPSSEALARNGVGASPAPAKLLPAPVEPDAELAPA